MEMRINSIFPCSTKHHKDLPKVLHFESVLIGFAMNVRFTAKPNRLPVENLIVSHWRMGGNRLFC